MFWFWCCLSSVRPTVKSALRLDNQAWYSCSWPAVFHHLSGSAVPGLNSVAWGRLLATGLQGAALGLNRVAKNSTAFRAAQCSVPTTLQAGKGRRSPGLPVDSRASVGVQPSVILQSLDCLKGMSEARLHSARVCVITSR